MNKFIFLILIIIITLNCTSTLSVEKSNLICSEKDKEYAEFWDNYYDPKEAYEFAEKIKKLVRDENLSGLFDLVEGELTSGPCT